MNIDELKRERLSDSEINLIKLLSTATITEMFGNIYIMDEVNYFSFYKTMNKLYINVYNLMSVGINTNFKEIIEVLIYNFNWDVKKICYE